MRSRMRAHTHTQSTHIDTPTDADTHAHTCTHGTAQAKVTRQELKARCSMQSSMRTERLSRKLDLISSCT